MHPSTCSRVDLPAPDGPMIETNSPSLISTLMRRRTKVLVGPCSKYFSILRSEIISTGIYNYPACSYPQREGRLSVYHSLHVEMCSGGRCRSLFMGATRDPMAEAGSQ